MDKKKHKKCEEENCKISASFNFKGEKQPKFCRKHADTLMIDVKHKRCEKEGCIKRASYNFLGEKFALYCAEHSDKDMVDIFLKKCEKDECINYAYYNYKEEKIVKYCGEHAEKDMINLKAKKCENENCEENAYYNYNGEKTLKFCSKHAEKDMINLKRKKCKKEGCEKSPSYNFLGETKRLYCSEHAIKGMVDIAHRLCQVKNCITRASYGYCGQKSILCTKHYNRYFDKKNVFINPDRTCNGNDTEDCKDIAVYGINEPLHCEDHKLENEIYLIAQQCKNCKRNVLLNNEGLCILFCQPEKIYEKKKGEKIKQKATLNFLDKYLKSDKIISVKDDIQINNTCNIKNRPDRIYDCGTHCVIIEVDENQHKSYINGCVTGELKRMHNIQLAMGMNCIFLRFNPDNFRVNNILQKINIHKRLKVLVNWIEKCIHMIPEKELEPVKYKYLFYDEYYEKDLTFKIIDDLELCKL